MKRFRKTKSVVVESSTHVSNNNNRNDNCSVRSAALLQHSNATTVTFNKNNPITSSIPSRATNREIGFMRQKMDTNVTGGGTGSGGTSTMQLPVDIFKGFEKTGRIELTLPIQHESTLLNTQPHPEQHRLMRKTNKFRFSLKYIKQQLKESNGPIFDRSNEFKSNISGAIYDLLWQGLRCNIKKDVILSVLHDIVALHEDFHSVILDIVNILDMETSLMTEGLQDERLAFTSLLKDLDRVVPDKLIKERLEIDTLQDVGIVKHKMFYTKFIKIKTKL